MQMTADQNPNVLFCKLATLEHAYAHTSSQEVDQYMIGAFFATAPECYHATLDLVTENQGSALKVNDKNQGQALTV